MTSLLQILAVVLATIAAGALYQTGRLLGVDAKGWRDAPAGVVPLLDALAAFWAVAAIVALQSPAIATPGRLWLAFGFAAGAVIALVVVARGRQRPPHMGDLR